MRNKNKNYSLLHPREFLLTVLVLCAMVSQSIAELNVWQANGPVHGNAWGYLAIAADPIRSEIVYTGTYHTANGYQGVIYKSINGGSPWTNISTGLDSSPILKIAIDRSDPNIVYATTYFANHKIYKSIDGGANWSIINFTGFTWSFQIARSDPRVIYAIGDDALRVSRNRGETWLTRQLPNQSPGMKVAVSPYDPNIVLASVCDYYDYKKCNPRLYRSVDSGLTWSQPILDLPGDEWFGIIEFDPLRPNVVYASGNGDTQPALYRSGDLGMTWASHSIPGGMINLEFDPRTPTVMYAAGMLNLSKSTDGGVSWAPFTNGIPQFGPGFQEVDFSADGRFIYAATSTGTFKVQVRSEMTGLGRVSGRVPTEDGRSVRGALVSAIDARGQQKWAVSNPFGYYTLQDVQTTVTYRMFATSKLHRFKDKILQVDGDLSGVDFIEISAD